MEETAFFVLGIALVVIAVGIAFAGLRWERFPPSRGVLGAIVGAVAALVVATGAFALIQAAEEQREHAAERAEEREAAAAERAAAQREELAAEEGEAQTGDPVRVFEAAGCSGCHTLEAAGSTATVGPDLDEALSGRDPQFIEESIVDPNAEIAEGFQPDVMPGTYEETLSPEEIEALVELLQQSASS